MDQSETWMGWGLCRLHPDLGWLNNSEKVGVAEAALMGLICTRCLVADECENFVDRERISGGFWAGQFRDQPDRSESVVGGVA